MMRGMALYLLVVFCLAAAGPNAEAACPPAPKPFAGPLFDAMAQVNSRTADDVLGSMENSGIKRMALFARIQGRKDGTWNVLDLKRRYPHRFVIGTPKRFDLRGDLPDDFVDDTLRQVRQGPYQFVGEILFVHADKNTGSQTTTGERYISAAAPNVQRLMAGLQTAGVPVMTHWEVYDWPRDWPLFDKLYSAFPRLTFIWPHAGFGSADQARLVLSRHPNVMITLSKRAQDERNNVVPAKAAHLAPPIIDSCGRIRPRWRALLAAYPTRFMFATDAHKRFRWDEYDSVVRTWRGLLGQLPAPEAGMIAWGNAARIYGKPR